MAAHLVMLIESSDWEFVSERALEQWDWSQDSSSSRFTGAREAVTTCGEATEEIGRKWERKWDVGGVGGEEQMGKGKRRRESRHNGKAITVLRCETLLYLLSQRAYMLKFENGKTMPLWVHLWECFGFSSSSVHYFMIICPSCCCFRVCYSVNRVLSEQCRSISGAFRTHGEDAFSVLGSSCWKSP